MRIVVGISGASGAIYAVRLLEELSKRSIDTILLVSETGEKIMEDETGIKKEDLRKLVNAMYDNDDFFSPLASGTFGVDGMVIVPCSVKTLSAVANGYADTLMARSAINCLKEGRKLILVLRETPLDLITIKNMLAAREAGAVILPAMPAFYHKPSTIDDMVNFVVGKILDQLNIEHELFPRWEGRKR